MMSAKLFVKNNNNNNNYYNATNTEKRKMSECKKNKTKQ